MPHIRQIPVEKAEGFLKKIFNEAIQRAGRVWHIVHVMSLNPRVMDTSMKFYGAVMYGMSPLTRWQREMLATVTSRANDCFY
ncbi:MAG: peroxidase [Gemmatimonadota bacterium]